MAARKLWKALILWMQIISVDLVHCSLLECDGIPSKKENFSFVAPTWPDKVFFAIKAVPMDRKVLINCTTTNADAKVTLQRMSAPGDWIDYVGHQSGQVFVLGNRHQRIGYFRCKASWKNQEICLYKGSVYLTRKLLFPLKMERGWNRRKWNFDRAILAVSS